jgi:hypothetical protein
MSAQTVPLATVLPREGQLIEFVVDGHDVTIAGTYAEYAFRSYHSAYAIDRVLTWRPMGRSSSVPAPARHSTDSLDDSLGGHSV